MIGIESYGCATAAGDDVDALWGALIEGADLSRGARSFLFTGERPASVRELLLKKLLAAYPGGAVDGVILASTKGFNQDFVWEREEAEDPISPLLDDFVREAGLAPRRAVCVSNACSSGIAALKLAELWIEQGLERVAVIAADAVTPFVRKGFEALNLISPTRPKPFDRNRDGFFLGEAAAAIVVSANLKGIRLTHLGLDTEGAAVTRPGASGESLARAISGQSADLVIAHGTGTPINDETEARVLPPGPVTGSKWCIGHTLGASAAIDVILACETLKRQTAFGLRTTETPIVAGALLQPMRATFGSVLVTSLGFGGMHACVKVSR